jgi:hypothetical protein
MPVKGDGLGIEEITAVAARGGGSALDDAGYHGRGDHHDAVDQFDLVFHLYERLG